MSVNRKKQRRRRARDKLKQTRLLLKHIEDVLVLKVHKGTAATETGRVSSSKPNSQGRIIDQAAVYRQQHRAQQGFDGD